MPNKTKNKGGVPVKGASNWISMAHSCLGGEKKKNRAVLELSTASCQVVSAWVVNKKNKKQTQSRKDETGE